MVTVVVITQNFFTGAVMGNTIVDGLGLEVRFNPPHYFLSRVQLDPVEALSAAVVEVDECSTSQFATITRALRNTRTPLLLIASYLDPEWLVPTTSHMVGILGRQFTDLHLCDALTCVMGGTAPPSRWHPTRVTKTKPALSPRELEILYRYCSGQQLSEIATALHITTSTVNTHLTRIRTKYRDLGREVGTRWELRQAALQDGLLPVEDLR